ncbi:MAG: hypothetical protein ACR2QS_03045 [Woeseiaceae bacterium]
MATREQVVSARADYIFVERPPGYEVNWDDQSQALLEISSACHRADCKKVLVVGPQTNVELTAFDILDLGKAIADIGIQVAVVELHNASNDAVSLLESSATNRGSPIRFFENIADAKTWLNVK